MTGINKQEETDCFPDRLKLAMGEMSARSLALQSGISPAAIHKYLAGKSEPTRPVLISIADTADVNLEWLMTGEGLMRRSKGSELVDLELYDGVIEAVEEYLLEQNHSPTPKNKIKAYHYLYDEFKYNLEIEISKVSRTLKLVFSR